MIPLWAYPLLFLTGLGAGFVDSIAGGGGLITLPVLLNLGLPTPDALGTNKLQAVFGSGAAAWHYARADLVSFKDCKTGILFTALGALAGALSVLQIHPGVLRQLIPWLLVLLAIYMLVQPRLGAEDVQPRFAAGTFHFFFGLSLGFYDGFLGPGTGSFWAMAYVLGLGFNLTRATAHTKVMNFTSNLASLFIFLHGGHALFGAGLTMGLGQITGARLGAGAVITRGARLIRPVFIGITLAITAKLLYDNFSKP